MLTMLATLGCRVCAGTPWRYVAAQYTIATAQGGCLWTTVEGKGG